MSLRAAAVCGPADSGRYVDREFIPRHFGEHILFLSLIDIWYKGPDLLFARTKDSGLAVPLFIARNGMARVMNAGSRACWRQPAVMSAGLAALAVWRET